jgi:hypothetical protein
LLKFKGSDDFSQWRSIGALKTADLSASAAIPCSFQSPVGSHSLSAGPPKARSRGCRCGGLRSRRVNLCLSFELGECRSFFLN